MIAAQRRLEAGGRGALLVSLFPPRDLGYSILRIDPDQPWHPAYLAQSVYIVPMALLFEWAIAIYDIELDNVRAGKKPWQQAKAELGGLWRKARRQITKDYVAFPLLSSPSAILALLGNVAPNAVRNVWAHTIIVCGHFRDRAETFTEAQLEDETRGDRYIRQRLGSCNLDGPPLLHLMSGQSLLPDRASPSPTCRAIAMTAPASTAWKRQGRRGAFRGAN